MPRILLATFVLALAALPLRAQLDLNGPNAVLTLNGVEPHTEDPVDHDVEILAPGPIEVKVTSGVNPNVPIVLFVTQHDPLNPEFPVPWGGSLDFPLTNVTVIGSGLDPFDPFAQFFFTDSGNPFTGEDPTFRLTLQIVQTYVGTHAAFQAVVFDASAGALPFDNTEIGDANFVYGNEVNVQTGEDGSVEVPFSVPDSSLLGTQTFEFHGVSYTSVNVAANGFVTFGGTTGLLNAGFDNDHVSWVADRPSIAGLLSDWSPTARAPGDGVFVQESQGRVRIAWGDPATTTGPGIAHFNDNDVNRFEIVLEMNDGLNPAAGSFSIATTALDPTAIVDYGNGLIGHTPGGGGTVGQELSLRSNTNVSSFDVPQIEEHDWGNNNASTVGWDGLGSDRGYYDVTRNWDGADVAFAPNAPFTVAGDAGYTSTPSTTLPQDDVVSIDLPNLVTTGGEIVTANGSFFGFDPTGSGSGTVLFDPFGNFGGPFPATVLSILDGTGTSGALAAPNPQPGPIRDGQGLVFSTPALPLPGIYDLQFNFTGGLQQIIPVTVSQPGIIQTSYTLGDDATVNHQLAPGMQIDFMGSSYSALNICSNGFIDFNVGTIAVNPSRADFWDGFQPGGGMTQNFGVAAFWTDLNFQVGLNGSTYDVTEDTVNDTVTVTFANQEYWHTIEPAGNVSVKFGQGTGANPAGTGNVLIDLTQTIPASMGSPQFVLFGVTDGDSIANGLGTGPETDFTHAMFNGSGLYDQLTLVGAYTSSMAFDSIAELFRADAALPYGNAIEFSELIGNGTWRVDLAP